MSVVERAVVWIVRFVMVELKVIYCKEKKDWRVGGGTNPSSPMPTVMIMLEMDISPSTRTRTSE